MNGIREQHHAGVAGQRAAHVVAKAAQPRGAGPIVRYPAREPNEEPGVDGQGRGQVVVRTVGRRDFGRHEDGLPRIEFPPVLPVEKPRRAVRSGDDALEILHGVGRLDLRDNGRRLAPRLADLANKPEILRATNERERDVVDALRETDAEVLLVILRERADAQRSFCDREKGTG